MRTTTAIKLVILGLFLLALGVAGKLFNHYTSSEYLSRTLCDEFARSVEAELSLDSARLDLGGVLRVERPAIRLAGEKEPLFTCREILIGLDVAGALRGAGAVKEVVLVEPTFNLVYQQQDRAWNFEAMFPKPAERKKPGEAPVPERKGPPEEMLREGILLQDATLIVQNAELFGDEEPREYPGLYLRLTPDLNATSSWHCEANFRRGPLAGSEITGWFVPGDRPQLKLDITCKDLAAGEALWHYVPSGKDIWEEYQVAGRLSLDAVIELLDTGCLTYSLKVRARDASAKTKFFPSRVSSINGVVDIRDDDVIINGLTGVIPAEEFGATATQGVPARIRMSGVSHGGEQGYSFQIEVVDLPLCRTSVEAVPEVGADLWRQFQPAGRSRFTLTLAGPPDGGDARFLAVLELQDVTLRPAEAPLPLEHVSGTVSVDNDTVRLDGLWGVLSQHGGPATGGRSSVAQFTADGIIDFNGKNSVLEVALRNIRTDEQLVKAIPACGEQIWEMLRPDVVLDASLLLRDKADSDDMSHSVVLELHGGQVTLEAFPLPLRNLSGTVKVDGSTVSVEHLAATLDTGDDTTGKFNAVSSVEARGVIDLEAEHAEVSLVARDLVLTEKLLKAIPNVGEDIWDAVRPEGTVSLRGKVVYDGQKERPLHYTLDLDLRDISVLPESLPVPVDALSGQLLVSENHMFSNYLVGVTCDGHFEGAGVIHYGAESEVPTYGARVRFEQVELAELIRCFGGGKEGVSGRIGGVLYVGGVLGDSTTTRGHGQVSLTEGYLWETPFFVGVVSLLHLAMPGRSSAAARGEAAVALNGDEVKVRELNLTGGGMDLSGYGSVWWDGKLDMTMVVVGAPEKGSGIPFVSPLVGWVLQTMERQLVRLEVSGTLSEPRFKHQVLSTITWPLTSLRAIVFSPFFRAKQEAPAEQ